MMDEREFEKKHTEAFECLQRKLTALGDEHDFEVEGGSGKLEILFEDDDETRFVISPNSPVRQIWISALTTSFKLGWSDGANAFVLDKTGETLEQVMSRILSQQLGTAVNV
jgi:iron donor protein CyaY